MLAYQFSSTPSHEVYRRRPTSSTIIPIAKAPAEFPTPFTELGASPGELVGDSAGLDTAGSSVGLTITMLVAVDTTPSDPVTVRVTLPLELVETGFVVLFVPFGNE